jgi:hypothetical protein
MTERAFPLPLDLTEEDLPKVQISYGLYSSKTGAGVEEVSLLGTGKVVLRRTDSYNAEPEVREGKLDLEVLLRLLELFEDQRFLGLEETSYSDHPGLRRIVTLTSPAVSKRVAVDNVGNAQFERVVSALLFAASLGEPQVLGRRFFKLMGPV